MSLLSQECNYDVNETVTKLIEGEQDEHLTVFVRNGFAATKCCADSCICCLVGGMFSSVVSKKQKKKQVSQGI